MTADPASVRTERLDLISMGLDFVRPALEGRIDEAERVAGVKLPPGWEQEAESTLRYRRAQMEADPSTREWLLRLVVERVTGEVAGYVNFHGPPEDRGWVEIGYVIEPRFRRRGFAFEAAMAMFEWAAQQGVGRFRASVSPDNEPSLAMVGKMGFQRTGEQWDDIDGLEYVFEATLEDIRRARTAAAEGGSGQALEPPMGDT